MKPLQGIRVADFGRFIAGPACGMLLGDFGAEVIRIENPRGAEDRILWNLTDDGNGASFIHLARNKRCLAYRPKSEAGAKITEKIVEWADIIIANLPEAGLAAIGIDWPRVQAINPKCILVTNTAFGTNGPLGNQVGFDGVAQAMSGAMYMTGEENTPTRAFVPYVDYFSAASATVGALCALIARDGLSGKGGTGKGQRVQTSLLHSAVFMNTPVLAEQAVLGTERKASLNRSQHSGPSDVFQTRDGWLLLQSLGDPQFGRLAELIGQADLIQDERFANDVSRGNNGAELSQMVATWMASRTTAEAQAALAEIRVPTGRVLSPQEALEDAHIRAVDILKDTLFPGVETPIPMATTPALLSDTPATVRQRAPLLAEHNQEVLSDLGFDAATVAQFKEKGAFDG